MGPVRKNPRHPRPRPLGVVRGPWGAGRENAGAGVGAGGAGGVRAETSAARGLGPLTRPAPSRPSKATDSVSLGAGPLGVG